MRRTIPCLRRTAPIKRTAPFKHTGLIKRTGLIKLDIRTPGLVRCAGPYSGVLTQQTPRRRSQVAAAPRQVEAGRRRLRRRAFARTSAVINARLRAIGPTVVD
jgi:hypothetical protein